MTVKLVSPGSFREMGDAAQAGIIAELERFGVDHAMYVFMSGAGRVTSVVPCCRPDAPCSSELYRIRRDMAPPSIAV